MPTIPASQIVNIIPGVTSAGGSGLNLNGLILSGNPRIPIGSVLSFPTALAALAFFGAGTADSNIAADYFGGYINSTSKPDAILYAQYNQSAVYPYLRGGPVSGLTLSQLQGLSGTLAVTLNGVLRSAASINLATATSFSNAAALITTGFASYDAVTGSGSTIAAGTATSVTGSITGNVLTVSAVSTGALVVGGVLSGTGVTAGTSVVNQLTGTAGGIGTYTVSAIQSVSSTAITQAYGLLTVATIVSGALAVGQVVSGGTIAAGTTITALGTGTGGAGTYITSGGSQTVAATAVSAGPFTATYDSVSGSFVLTGGTPGTTGTIAYATGSLAASLDLTSATGAVLSQGAAPTTPSAIMASIVAQTTNWASFMTAFDPDNGYGNATKLLFSTWNGQQNNRYAYVCWDTDSSPTVTVPATSSLGYLIAQASISGTMLINEPDYNIAAFICGAIASINFNATNGRATLAFKSQSGIAPTVTNATVAANLIANGYNFYGTYATASQQFTFFNPGSVSGVFKWADSYINQIWLNNAFQQALMNLLTNLPSIPYNAAGYALVRAALMDPIAAGLNFGAFRGGVPLSAVQIAEVNNAAGTPIDSVLSSTGWYLQILPATAMVRGNRTTPPVNFWYMDGGSIQQISMASLEVQ